MELKLSVPRSVAVVQELWKQIIANVMNIKVDVLEVEEGPSLGGAMLAAVGCGVYRTLRLLARSLQKVVDTVEPTPELAAKYEERYQKFKELYPAMKPLFKPRIVVEVCLQEI